MATLQFQHVDSVIAVNDDPLDNPQFLFWRLVSTRPHLSLSPLYTPLSRPPSPGCQLMSSTVTHVTRHIRVASQTLQSHITRRRYCLSPSCPPSFSSVSPTTTSSLPPTFNSVLLRFTIRCGFIRAPTFDRNPIVHQRTITQGPNHPDVAHKDHFPSSPFRLNSATESTPSTSLEATTTNSGYPIPIATSSPLRLTHGTDSLARNTVPPGPVGKAERSLWPRLLLRYFSSTNKSTRKPSTLSTVQYNFTSASYLVLWTLNYASRSLLTLLCNTSRYWHLQSIYRGNGATHCRVDGKGLGKSFGL